MGSVPFFSFLFLMGRALETSVLDTSCLQGRRTCHSIAAACIFSPIVLSSVIDRMINDR